MADLYKYLEEIGLTREGFEKENAGKADEVYKFFDKFTKLAMLLKSNGILFEWRIYCDSNLGFNVPRNLHFPNKSSVAWR